MHIYIILYIIYVCVCTSHFSEPMHHFSSLSRVPVGHELNRSTILMPGNTKPKLGVFNSSQPDCLSFATQFIAPKTQNWKKNVGNCVAMVAELLGPPCTLLWHPGCQPSTRAACSSSQSFITRANQNRNTVKSLAIVPKRIKLFSNIPEICIGFSYLNETKKPSENGFDCPLRQNALTLCRGRAVIYGPNLRFWQPPP